MNEKRDGPKGWWETQVDKWFEWFSGPGFKRWVKNFLSVPPYLKPLTPEESHERWMKTENERRVIDESISRFNEMRPPPQRFELTNLPWRPFFWYTFLAITLGITAGNCLSYYITKWQLQADLRPVMEQYEKQLRGR